MPAKAKIALLIACFFWAISFIATKVALASAPPLTVVALRLIVSALCYLLWFAIRRPKINFGGLRWWGQLLILSLFGTGLHYGVQTVGLQYTTASNASLYAVTAPITILILGAILLRERISYKKAGGIFIALCGVLIVMGLDTLMSFELQGHVLGDVLVFSSIFMWGLFTVFGKQMTDQLGAWVLTGLVTLVGALQMIPISLAEISHHSFSLSQISLEGWLAIVFLGVSCSFLATLLYFMALQRSQSQKVGVYLYTIPPMTAVFAALYLGETLGLNLLIGSVLVFSGVYLTEKG